MPVLSVFVLMFAVATPPVGENPPAKFRVCAQIVVVDTFCEVKLLVVMDDVKIWANESIPPSLIIVYQLFPFARNPIAP